MITVTQKQIQEEIRAYRKAYRKYGARRFAWEVTFFPSANHVKLTLTWIDNSGPQVSHIAM